MRRVYLKEVRALGRNMQQEGTFLVTVHEVGTRLGVLVVIKMLVSWNIHDLHLWVHEGILVAIGRQANEAAELFLLTSILRLFEVDIMEPLLFASEHDWLRLCA